MSVLRHFQNFSNTVDVSFIGGGSARFICGGSWTPEENRKSPTIYHMILYRVHLAKGWNRTHSFCDNRHWLHI